MSLPWSLPFRKGRLIIKDSASNEQVSEEKSVEVTGHAHVSLNLPLDKVRGKTVHERNQGNQGDLLPGRRSSSHQLSLPYPLNVPYDPSTTRHDKPHGSGLDERIESTPGWNSADCDGPEARSNRNRCFPREIFRHLIEYAPGQRESSKANGRRRRSRSGGRSHHGHQYHVVRQVYGSSERRSRSTHSTRNIEPEPIAHIPELIPHERRLEGGPFSQLLTVVRYQPPAYSLTAQSPSIIDVYRQSPFKDQPHTKKVTPDTFFVSLLLATNPTKRSVEYQIFRIELDRSEVDDKILFQKLKSTYRGIRGWRRRFSFKGVTDIKFAQVDSLPENYTQYQLTFIKYYQDGLPQYHSNQCQTPFTEPHFRRLIVAPLSRPIDYEDFAGYSHLFHYFNNPKKVQGSKRWVGAVSQLKGSQPMAKWNRNGQLTKSVYAPPLDEPSGQGLIFREGWLVNRIIATGMFIVLASLVIAIVWSLLRTIEQGIAAGSYVLAASSGLVGIVSLVSALDDIG